MSSIIRTNVLKLYAEDHNVVNDDAKLLERYHIQFDGWLESRSLYWNLSHATPGESITRARRRLHELGLIKYSTDALEARTERFIEERDDHSDYTPAVSWQKD